jgi:hypothetical protein
MLSNRTLTNIDPWLAQTLTTRWDTFSNPANLVVLTPSSLAAQ